MINESRFGKDHWSTFAYIETRCVDYSGVLNKNHMRCDEDRHPGHVNSANAHSKKKHPTILKGFVNVSDHDDWDCVDDLENAGFLESHGTGLHPVFKLTTDGRRVAALLRDHKSNGGSFGSFAEGIR